MVIQNYKSAVIRATGGTGYYMKSIHLFAGIGGGIIADVAAGNQVCGAVEINPFCRQVLEARQRDGWLPSFPILTDVRSVQGDEFGENIELV